MKFVSSRSLSIPIMMLTIVALAALSATAQMPPMPGMTSGNGDNGMKHADISLSGTTLSIDVYTSPATPVTMMTGSGYTGKWAFLNGADFNAQYGWNPSGFISLPTGNAIWIKRTGLTTPVAGSLNVYEGGTGMDMASWTLDPLYQNDGDIWQWDGVMQHDLYVGTVPGLYTMSFEVYIGDENTGVANNTYTPATTTFEFLVPEPGSLLLLAGGGAFVLTRRLRRGGA